MKRLDPSILSLALATAGLAGTAAAQSQWLSVQPNTVPPQRAQHGFVATLPQQPAIMFGGEHAGLYRNDTWSWNGVDWTLLTPTTTSPSPRGGFAMSFDPLRNRIVLFSGWNGGSYVPDTWEWDGLDWQQMSPAAQPPPRDWSAMAFDFTTARTILFGGHDWQRSSAGLGNYGDTWAWDGANWTQLSPNNSPAPRWGHAMVFDKTLGRVILFGGTGGVGDTWSWNGNDWQPVPTATQPPPRWRAALVYDDLRRRSVLFGGVDAGTIRADLWEFDGIDWMARTPAGTGPVVVHTGAIFDGFTNHVLNFGGALIPNRSSTSDKTDAYGAVNPASSQPFGTGCAGSAGTPALACDRLAWIGEEYRVDLAAAPANAPTFLLLGFSNTRAGSFQLPLSLGTIGMVGCSLFVAPTVTLPMTASSAGRAIFALPVPNDPVLPGKPVYGQVFVADPGINPVGLTVSDACEHRFGGK